MRKGKNFKPRVITAPAARLLVAFLALVYGSGRVTYAQPFGSETAALNSSTLVSALARADSLLADGAYEPATAVLAQIAAQAPSPSLFLRLAFAHEQAGQAPDALWALRCAYEVRPDRSILRKMDALAAAYHLAGYEYGDRYFFFTLLRRYYQLLLETIVVIGVVVATTLILRLRRRPMAQPWAGALLAYIGFSALTLNLLHPEGLGREVIVRTPTPLMSAPAAGGNWLATVPAGQQLPVVGGAEDIWLPVRWQGTRAWVRVSSLYHTQVAN